MTRRANLLAMALTVFAALTVPPAASASVLTSADNLGAPIPAGKEIKFTSDPNNRLVIYTELGEVACEEMAMNAVVTKDEEGEFEGEGVEIEEEGGSASGCEDEGIPVIITPKVLGFHSEETGTGEAKLTFIVHIPAFGISCHYATPPGTWGVFHYSLPSSSTITLTETELESQLCGQAFISGSMQVETPTGVAIILE